MTESPDTASAWVVCEPEPAYIPHKLFESWTRERASAIADKSSDARGTYGVLRVEDLLLVLAGESGVALRVLVIAADLGEGGGVLSSGDEGGSTREDGESRTHDEV